ncbi:glycosyl hydrolase family 18 protein [Thermococcus nautili]|uniref:Chitinase n=1 Tax=Thermococcus nautili TaxID=195522 RepID=W8P1P1_9EURY|nr:glycosyl hydrolase family 18 protein [Thermococcus nautili]AHL22681.1 Chitinase [Thermococcus nautili]
MNRVLSILLVFLVVCSIGTALPGRASANNIPQLNGNILGWDAVNLTWNPVKGAIAYRVYRSTSMDNLTESLLITVNWSNYSKFNPGEAYLTGEIVEYNGSLWRAKHVTSSPPGGGDWERLGPIIPATNFVDDSLRGNTTYYYFIRPVFKGGKLGRPSNVLIVKTPPQPYRIVVYYISWGIYARAFSPYSIPFENVTHVLYAFLKPLPNGTVTWADPYADPMNFEALQRLKKKYPAVKILVSVGGWTLSKYFSDIAADPIKRENFAGSVVEILKKYGFDGVDIDWEYPGGGGMEGNHVRPDDGENFVLLLKTLRKALDNASTWKHYLLTVAAPADTTIASRVNWGEVSKIVDFIDVMAYDYAGPWLNVTYFNAPLYRDPSGPGLGSVNETISWYLKRVPGEKLVLGVPFYGRSFANVPPTNHGLYQPFNGTPSGTWGPAVETHGVMDYWDIAGRIASGKCTRYWSSASKVPWAYCRGVFITYDDPESIAIKVEYALNHTLGGVMVWEITADRKPKTESHPLLAAILRTLGEKPPAWIPDEHVLGVSRRVHVGVQRPTTASPPETSSGICGPGAVLLFALAVLPLTTRRR